MATARQEERTQRILQAALKEFCYKGYREVNVDVIASEAKVSKATIYNHFKNKENLFMAVFDYAMGQLDEKIHHELNFLDLRRGGKAATKAFLKNARENPDYSFFFKALTTDAGFVSETLRQKMMDHFLSSGMGISRQQLRMSQERGEIKQLFDPDLLFIALLGMHLHVLSYLERSKQKVNLDQCAEQIDEILQSGIFA
ncbi:MAG: TetR/AcrR family transcriptional regulator [Candidatus Riflebacteria bacterium]|nr:TetR/AcrR family transcriptional regulator [Candidatus Riflebacteria bacterium]